MPEIDFDEFWHKVNVDTMRDYLTDDVYLNARLWRFLGHALRLAAQPTPEPRDRIDSTSLGS